MPLSRLNGLTRAQEQVGFIGGTQHSIHTLHTTATMLAIHRIEKGEALSSNWQGNVNARQVGKRDLVF